MCFCEFYSFKYVFNIFFKLRFLFNYVIFLIDLRYFFFFLVLYCFFYLDIMIIVNEFFIILIVVFVILIIWFIFVIKVIFFIGIFIEFIVVNKIMKDVFGIFVIFFEVSINISIKLIWVESGKWILYICVIKSVVIVWYKVDLFKLNEYLVGIINDVIVFGYLNFFIFFISFGKIVLEFVVVYVKIILFFKIFISDKMFVFDNFVIKLSIINIKKIIV